MIPVPGLDSVRCAWIEIRNEGFNLYGFLLYRSSDQFFPEYLDGRGLDDLNIWTGEDCGVFVVKSPSSKWIEYTRATNHTWWKLYGHHANENAAGIGELSRGVGYTAVLNVGEEVLTLREVFAPCLNEFHHSDEIAKILRRFGLRPTEHPCLSLFKDIQDREIWFVDLRDMRGLQPRELGEAFQKWFEGPEFGDLMEESRHA